MVILSFFSSFTSSALVCSEFLVEEIQLKAIFSLKSLEGLIFVKVDHWIIWLKL
jgi:hypothetical protein